MSNFDAHLVADLASVAARDASEAVRRKVCLAPTISAGVAVSKATWAIIEAEARFRRKIQSDATLDALVDELEADLQNKMASSGLGPIFEAFQAAKAAQAS